MSPQNAVAPVHFGFLALRSFSMIAFSNAVEVLRMANYVCGRPIYRWTLYSADGSPVTASNGFTLAQTGMIDDHDIPDILFVCGGVDVDIAVDPDVVLTLQHLANRKVALGALCTGAYALAKAELLNGYKCAIHWENTSALRETFPQTLFTDELFVIDRDRYTCTGGTAPLDMMLNLISPHVGKHVAAGISDQFIINRIRDGKDQQHIPMAARLGYNHRALSEAATLMEANMEEPLSLDELADMVMLSQRQLQRMFRTYLGLTPTQYYLNLRLRRARELLLQTSMSIMDVTIACGFQSSCHFSKSYRNLFGYSPSRERRHRIRSDASLPNEPHLVGENERWRPTNLSPVTAA